MAYSIFYHLWNILNYSKLRKWIVFLFARLLIAFQFGRLNKYTSHFRDCDEISGVSLLCKLSHGVTNIGNPIYMTRCAVGRKWFTRHPVYANWEFDLIISVICNITTETHSKKYTKRFSFSNTNSPQNFICHIHSECSMLWNICYAVPHNERYTLTSKHQSLFHTTAAFLSSFLSSLRSLFLHPMPYFIS